MKYKFKFGTGSGLPYKFACIFVILSLLPVFSSGIYAAESSNTLIMPQISDINADAYIVVDLHTGQIILQKDPNRKVYPASLTKILTSLIAIDSLERDDVITTSQYAGSLNSQESKIDLIPGEKMTFENMLFGMMLSSGNDCAVAIGEHISGNVANFALLMNQKSLQIGTTASKWVNPAGTHDSEQYTTAADLALITRFAYKSDLFREIVGTKHYSLPPTNMHPFSNWNVLENTNKLLVFQDSFYKSDLLYEVLGVKTGTTTAAGSNLITIANAKNGLELVCVIVGVRDRNARNIWAYTMTLLEEAAKTTNGVQQILNTSVGITDSADDKLFYPKRNFSVFIGNTDPIEYETSFAETDIIVKVGKDILFKTGTEQPTSSTSSSNTSSQSINSESNGGDNPGNFKTVAKVIAIVLAIILYTLLLWVIFNQRKRSKRIKSINRRNNKF